MTESLLLDQMVAPCIGMGDGGMVEGVTIRSVTVEDVAGDS